MIDRILDRYRATAVAPRERAWGEEIERLYQVHVRQVDQAIELDERLHTLPLFKERFVCVLPKNHNLAAQDAVKAGQLKDEPYVNRINCEMGSFAGDLFRAQGVEPKMVFRSERDEWVRQP